METWMWIALLLAVGTLAVIGFGTIRSGRHHHEAGGVLADSGLMQAGLTQADRDWLRPSRRETEEVLQDLYNRGEVVRPAAPVKDQIESLIDVYRPSSVRIDGEDIPIDYPFVTSPDQAERISMRSRFMPRRYDTRRSLELADQIVADQQIADEEPGEVVHVPAPGEEGFEPPHGFVEVEIGDFIFRLIRGNPEVRVEQRKGGVRTLNYSVPSEWSEPMIALAFEVHRLRQGWSVTSTERYRKD